MQLRGWSWQKRTAEVQFDHENQKLFYHMAGDPWAMTDVTSGCGIRTQPYKKGGREVRPRALFRGTAGVYNVRCTELHHTSSTGPFRIANVHASTSLSRHCGHSCLVATCIALLLAITVAQGTHHCVPSPGASNDLAVTSADSAGGVCLVCATTHVSVVSPFPQVSPAPSDDEPKPALSVQNQNTVGIYTLYVRPPPHS